MLAAQEIAWLILTPLIFLGWTAFIGRRYSRDFSMSERLMASFVCGISQIVGTTIILGSFNILYWWPLFIINASIAAFWLILSLHHDGTMNLLVKLGKSMCVFGDVFKSSIAICIIGLMALLISAWVIYLGQLLPSVGYDSWGYHYLWAALCRQTGNIGYDNLSDPMISVYPWNTDILFLWWIIGAQAERWSNIAQAPFALAAALACYRMARNAGVRRADAAIAGLFVFSVPTVIHQMWVAYVDLAVMGATLISCAFLSRKRLTPAALAIAGASAFYAHALLAARTTHLSSADAISRRLRGRPKHH